MSIIEIMQLIVCTLAIAVLIMLFCVTIQQMINAKKLRKEEHEMYETYMDKIRKEE